MIATYFTFPVILEALSHERLPIVFDARSAGFEPAVSRGVTRLLPWGRMELNHRPPPEMAALFR